MVVAAHVADLGKVAEGVDTGGLVQGTLELLDGDGGVGSGQRECKLGECRAFRYSTSYFRKGFSYTHNTQAKVDFIGRKAVRARESIDLGPGNETVCRIRSRRIPDPSMTCHFLAEF